MATKSKKPSKTAAAKAEKDGAERTVEWQGLTLTLPPLLPESVTLRLVRIEESMEPDDPSPTWKLLTSIIGTEQLDAVIRTVERAEGVGVVDVVELVAAIFEQYGVSEGE